MIILTVMLLLSTTNPIPCWKARALIAYAGSPAEAEKIALQNGYTKSQVAEVRRRCGL